MKGEVVHIQVAPEETHVFNADTGLRVSGDVASAAAIHTP
jgi:hypothetical protein